MCYRLKQFRNQHVSVKKIGPSENINSKKSKFTDKM